MHLPPRFHAGSDGPGFVPGPLWPLPSLPSGAREGGQLCPSLLPITPPRPWRSCFPAPGHCHRLHRPHGSVHGNPAAHLALQHWLCPSPVRSATSTTRSLGTIRMFPSSLCQGECVWLWAVTCPATEVLEQPQEPWGA